MASTDPRMQKYCEKRGKELVRYERGLEEVEEEIRKAEAH